MKSIVPWKRVQQNELASVENDPFEILHRQVDDLFDQFSNSFFGSLPWRESRKGPAALREPKVDFTETDKGYELTAELPGVEERDLDLSVDENMLTLKAEQSRENERKEKDYHIMERSSGSYQRTIPLPADVDREKIRAKFKNGVLSVAIPRNPEIETSKRKIAIEG